MGVYDFLNRHRNKIMLAGGAVGAVMVINKVLSGYEKQWETSSSKAFVHEAKKKEVHFDNIINECNQLSQRMTSRMMNRLEELMDDKYLMDKLKELRKGNNSEDKLETWKQLRLNILTKLLSELYCTCILVCSTRVQMSIVGAQVYVSSLNHTYPKQQESSSAKTADLSNMKAYTKYHALLGSFFEQRFDCLIRPLEEITAETLDGIPVDSCVGIREFEVMFKTIKSKFSDHLNSPDSKVKVLFLGDDKLSTVDLASICPDSGSLTERDEKVLRNLLSETQDIFESDDFKHVLEASIDVGYNLLLDRILIDAFVKTEYDYLHLLVEEPPTTGPAKTEVPMVKLIPHLRNNYIKRNEADKKILVNCLLGLDVLNCFAANVYEAFCVPK